jgi:hypothetical protein
MDAVPHEIRALARRIAEQGEAARADARALRDGSRAIGWTGLAGADMVASTNLQARLLEEIGSRHDVAARALEAHAAAVEETLATIAEIERRVGEAVAAARSRVGRFLHGLLDAVDPGDEVLASFSPPPPGSPQWLEVRLPRIPLPARPR